MRWFRLYDDVLNDPKVQRLDGDTFKFWINMLCIASKRGGVLPSIEDMAFEMRVSVLVCTMKIDALKTAGLVDGDKRLRPHGWEKRQYKSDTSTERVKRFRERSSNVAVTVDETGPDTDTDTEQKQIKKTNKKSRSASSAEFEQFWNDYPRKINKAQASKAFAKAMTKATAEEICSGVKAYPFSDDQQFIPHPATWLNQERWSGLEQAAKQGEYTQEQLDKFEKERVEWLRMFRESQLSGKTLGIKPPSIT